MSHPFTPSSVKLGPFELHSVETGRFRLDGGAIFGVVPKTLWSRHIEADDKNRIPLAMRLLLIRSEQSGRIYLVDNGSGDKFNEKMQAILALDYEHSELVRSLAACGVTPEEVTDIIFTHLHFDHCGGTTLYGPGDELRHRFPRAAYHVTKKHHESALNPNDREKASFLPENIGPITESERLNLVEDLHVYEEGLSTLPAHGHTAGQQLPVLEAEGKTIVFVADLFPTHAHLPSAWVAGYDVQPMQSMTEKKALLSEAVKNNWYLFLEHDAEHELITVAESDGKFFMKESLRLSDLI